MSQQLSITIPDALAERLKAVKQRFNVSGVCQDAIESEVTKQEYLMKEPKDMEQIMKRLRAEKQELTKEMHDMGHKHGLEDAKQMSYGDLREAERTAEAQAALAGQAVLSQEPAITGTGMWENWLREETEEVERDMVECQHGVFDLESYLEGWLEGVMEFWQKIKDKL